MGGFCRGLPVSLHRLSPPGNLIQILFWLKTKLMWKVSRVCVRSHALRRQKPNKGRTFYNYVIILFQQIKTGFLFFSFWVRYKYTDIWDRGIQKRCFWENYWFFCFTFNGIELAIGSLVIELLFVKKCLKYIWNWNSSSVFACLFRLLTSPVFTLIVDGGGRFSLKVWFWIRIHWLLWRVWR